MKNLLVISSRYPHKYDTTRSVFIYSQIEELKKNLEKVLIISSTPYTPKFYTKWKESRRLSDSLAKNYNYDNVKVYYTKNIIVHINTLKIFRGLQGFLASMRILKKTKFKPDIIHAHFTWPSGYIAMKLKENFKIPYIITGHGYDVYDLPFRNKFYFNTVKKILYHANHIITISQSTKDVMVKKLNVPIEKITIVSNGYDEKLFHSLNKNIIRNKLSLPLDKKIVLSVGNIVPIKGHINLVKAAEIIINKHKDILFIIVGEGPEKKKLEKEIKKNNIENNFILVGPKPHKEIPFWINACDIFTIPSLNESGPVVLFEALACGKPVIGTKVGLIPEIIQNDKLGLIVPPGDVNVLTKGILNALESRWDKKYIQNSIKDFTWDKISVKILEIYNSVLEQKNISNKI